MSFHGGLLGVCLVLAWRAKKMNTDFLQLGDFVAPLVPIGLGAGRIGNFINAELWGRPSELPWAIIFPNVGGEARHPSQLYEFVFEGLILFLIVWLISATPRRVGFVGGVFLTSYALFRFSLEFFRAPDAHLGLYQMGLSQGQVLSLPMLGIGIYLIMRSRSQPISHGAGAVVR